MTDINQVKIFQIYSRVILLTLYFNYEEKIKAIV